MGTMSATAAPAPSDRSDFRTVTTGGAAVGVLTAVAVVAFLAASRLLPDVRGGVESLIVLAAGITVAFLPAQRTGARGVDGIAGAAAVGLVGTVVFSAIDIVLLRPFKAYPWTWDAIGGGSTWWYLPVWWMLGTFAAWMGAIVTARAATPDVPSPLARRALPLVAATVIAVAVVRLAGMRVALPVLTGGAFTLTLAALALVALARKR
ncbi:MAG: hypothetical protein DMD34_00105 [Gemmatimonadetes bacterium]|nr:MAG: hypothetical protein DMD46_01790 [Gemmatimonadota bacterium]PYP99186.1 MAG: hypothetical protein DMD34_00105 [Gemmatimonadota bacterium]